MSINRKISRGTFWSFVEKIGQQVFGLAIFGLVARIIGPSEYGLVSLCYVYLAISTPLTSNLVDGIISLRIRDEESLSTMFWFIIVIGFSASLIQFFVAPYIALFMQFPKLEHLLKIFSILPIPLSLASIPTTLVHADLSFKTLAQRTLIASFVSGLIGLIMALEGFGAYAIAAQQIAHYSTLGVFVWLKTPWRPSFVFNIHKLKWALRPGFKLMLFNFLVALEANFPRYMIGATLGSAAVGYFAFVTRLILAIQELTFSPIASVVHPAISLVAESPRALSRVLTNIIGISGLVAFPVFFGAAAVADVAVPTLFGDKWNPAVLPLELLAIFSAVNVTNLILQDFVRALNKIQIATYVRIFCFIATIFCFYAFVQSLVGFVIILGSSYIITLFFNIIIQHKLAIINIFDPLRIFPAFIGASFAMFFVVNYIITLFPHGFSGLSKLLISCLSGAFVYAILIVVFCRPQLEQYKEYFIKGVP